MHPPAKAAHIASASLSQDGWRLLVAAVFLLSLLLQLGLATWLHLHGLINAGELAPLVVKLLTLYAAPLGVITAGIFLARQASPPIATSTGWVVLLLAIIWNTLLLGRYLLLIFSPDDDIAQLASFQDTVTPIGSFLTSAALAFLYGQKETNAPTPTTPTPSGGVTT